MKECMRQSALTKDERIRWVELLNTSRLGPNEQKERDALTARMTANTCKCGSDR